MWIFKIIKIKYFYLPLILEEHWTPDIQTFRPIAISDHTTTVQYIIWGLG